MLGLVETWLEEKDWSRMSKLLPKKFKWKWQFATKERRRGRAMGGILSEVRKGIEEVRV